MPLKPRYHYAWFEAQTPDENGVIRAGKYGLQAKKFGSTWRTGQMGQSYNSDTKKYSPTEFQVYGLEFHPNKIICTGYPWTWAAALGGGLKRYSQASRIVKSPIFEWGPIQVQGEGALVIEHEPDGSITSVHTQKPALQKTWHKELYAQEKEKRRKAEKTLKIMMKMGVMGDGDVGQRWGYVGRNKIDTVDFSKLYDSLADADGKTDNKTLEELSELLRDVRSVYGDDAESAFETIRHHIRDQVYQKKNVYTWEPVLDGRDRIDL